MNCLNSCCVVLKRDVWHVTGRPKPHFYLTRLSSRTVTACGQTSVCFLPPTCCYCRCLQSKRNSQTHTHAKWAVKDAALQYFGCCKVFFLLQKETVAKSMEAAAHVRWPTFIRVDATVLFTYITTAPDLLMDVEQWQLGEDLIQYCRVDVCSQWRGCLLIRAICFLPVLSAANED